MKNLSHKHEGIVVVPEPSKERLNSNELVDYHAHRVRFIDWMIYEGKKTEPNKPPEGYAHSTATRRCTRSDQFYRFVWDEKGRYTKGVTPNHADDWITHIIQDDRSNSDRAKHHKMLKCLMRWRSSELGEAEWVPKYTFTEGAGQNADNDPFKHREREKLREGALQHGSVPHYNALRPNEREEWKRYLSQRFSIPKSEIGPEDFEQANSAKLASIVGCALDAGLRPCEIKSARVGWFRDGGGVPRLEIPEREAAKNGKGSVRSLSDWTGTWLREWINEREHYHDRKETYEDTDAMWLTREGNRYSPQSLNRMLERVCDTANVRFEDRSFYNARHSAGTVMSEMEGLEAAREQLGHSSKLTTMRYDNTPPERRKRGLEKGG